MRLYPDMVRFPSPKQGMVSGHPPPKVRRRALGRDLSSMKTRPRAAAEAESGICKLDYSRDYSKPSDFCGIFEAM